MKSLMRDVYLLDEIDGGEIRLVDPKRENVEAEARVLETSNQVRNKGYVISVTDDRKEALKKADFVMATFSPGSMDPFYHDLEIPIKNGFRIPVLMTDERLLTNRTRLSQFNIV
jgi:alpha-galactosidase/6-phospho-beta-glucosidase family protein